jgi:elongator complex protein 3
VRRDYHADPCHESFLTFEDGEETLFALLRLSVLGTTEQSAGGSCVATVRELHVFGPEVDLGENQEGAVQHRGLGARLLREAEHIAAVEYGATSLRVLSGVGVRGYYAELGYVRQGPYMVKGLEPAAA